MKAAGIELQFYLKTTVLFVGLFAFVAILYITQGILVPLVFSLIIAILLHPVVHLLMKWHINRILAILISIFLTILLIGAVGTLLYTQALRFSDSWPLMVERITAVFNQSITWSSGYLDINPRKIHEWFITTKNEAINSSTAVIGQTIINVGIGLIVVFLIPVYIFLILYYEPLLLDFIRKLSGDGNQIRTNEIISQTKKLIQRYLVGLLIEAVLVAALDTSALLILGIQYAVLLGIIAALLNVIPYIGGIIAVAMPMMIALATKSSPWYAVYVLVAYYIIQLIDNHYIIPIIVASKVRINALFSIIVVFVGDAIWGIPGMFLSIPMLAIVKLIFDHIEPLKPWGFLLGDTMPPILKLKPVLQKLKKL